VARFCSANEVGVATGMYTPRAARKTSRFVRRGRSELYSCRALRAQIAGSSGGPPRGTAQLGGVGQSQLIPPEAHRRVHGEACYVVGAVGHATTKKRTMPRTTCVMLGAHVAGVRGRSVWLQLVIEVHVQRPAGGRDSPRQRRHLGLASRRELRFRWRQSRSQRGRGPWRWPPRSYRHM